MQAGRPADAVKILDHVLVLTNLPSVRVERALAYIADTQFEPAQSDLRELEKEGYNPPVVNFGLRSWPRTARTPTRPCIISNFV